MIVDNESEKIEKPIETGLIQSYAKEQEKPE